MQLAVLGFYFTPRQIKCPSLQCSRSCWLSMPWMVALLTLLVAAEGIFGPSCCFDVAVSSVVPSLYFLASVKLELTVDS